MEIYVDTPQGKKHHGKTWKEWFIRDVTDGDIMNTLNSWSYHPSMLKKFSELGIRHICYRHPERWYYISVDDSLHFGFQKTFRGGPTFYVPIDKWTVVEKGNREKLFEVARANESREQTLF